MKTNVPIWKSLAQRFQLFYSCYGSWFSSGGRASHSSACLASRVFLSFRYTALGGVEGGKTQSTFGGGLDIRTFDDADLIGYLISSLLAIDWAQYAGETGNWTLAHHCVLLLLGFLEDGLLGLVGRLGLFVWFIFIVGEDLLQRAPGHIGLLGM